MKAMSAKSGTALVAAAFALTMLIGGPNRHPVAAAYQQATPSPELLKETGGDGVLTNCNDPAFAPMEYYENESAEAPIGFDIDLANEIGRRLGIKIESVPTEFGGLLPGLQSGRCDIVLTAIYATPERLAAFGGQPYFDTSAVLLTRADNNEIHAPEDLSGKTIAVQAATVYVDVLNELNKRLTSEGKEPVLVQSYPKQTDATQQIVVGRADATITQDTEAAYRAQAQPGQFKIAYTYPNPQTFAMYYRKDATALAAALKSTLEAMRADGTLASLATKWNLPEAGAKFSDLPTGTPVATPAS